MTLVAQPSQSKGILDGMYRGLLRRLRRLGQKAQRLRKRRRVLPAVASRLTEEARHRAAVERELHAMRASDRPILVGPWLGEVGFEILYWIPFLRAAVARHQLDPSRLVIYSRGGVASWYGELCGRYLELFERVDAEGFARGNEERVSRTRSSKQAVIDDFDLALREAILPLIGEHHWLHPSLMIRCFRYSWLHALEPVAFGDLLAARRLEPPAAPTLALPERYVAVKFYSRSSLPDEQANRRRLVQIMGRLRERGPVVELATGLQIDDHGELVEGVPPTALGGQPITAANNLALQTQVMAGADAFVGTYGGMCYVAALLGVDAIGLCANDVKLKPIHLALAHQACEQVGGGRVLQLGFAELDALRGAGL